MKIKLSLLVITLFYAQVSAQQISSTPTNVFVAGNAGKVHVFLLIGQSNMVGRDTNGIKIQTTDQRIAYLDNSGHLQVAIEPMHQGGSGMGPGIPFALQMIKNYPNQQIILVPCAVGGTPLSRWVKGADLYERAVKRAKIAMAMGTLDGVVWHQGESDSNNAELAQSYQSRLVQMFTDLRADLEKPKLPIVVGQLGEFVKYTYSDVVKAAIKQMPEKLPGVAFADSNGLTDKGDHLHFNTASQQQFGQRYAAAMLTLLPNTSKNKIK
jgi:hypothetical protein